MLQTSWSVNNAEMKLKLSLLLFCFFGIPHISLSQKNTDNFLVDGRLLDIKTREGIPFVSIYFLKSQHGTSSDDHGYFSLRLNKTYLSDTLVFSAIGYKTSKKTLSEVGGTANHIIYLEEDIVNLNEVTVMAKPAVEIIKQAMKNRARNYGTEPHKLAGLYRISDRENGAYVRLAEAAIAIYDEDYLKKDSRAVDYLALRHSRDFRTFQWKMDNLNSRTVEELLKPDLIKRPTRATHPNGFEKGFFYAFERYATLEGQEVYLISATKNPAYEWPNYNAVFYVRAEDLAIIRVDRDYSISRPHWAKAENVITKITKDQLILKYKEQDGKLYLNYFLWNLEGEVVAEKNKNKVISFERKEELNIHGVSFEEQKKIRTAWDKDIYKMTESYNAAFWENHPVSNTQLFKDVTKELDEREDLQKQFQSDHDHHTLYNLKKRYKVNELKSDFKLLRESLEESHPSLYRYTSKDSLDSFFDSTYSLLTRPMTELEFFKLITPLIATIRCGHTRSALSESHYKFNKYRAFYFPVQTTLIDGKLIVSASRVSGDSIFKGNEILAINGTSIHDIKRTINRHIEADGYIQTYKDRIFGDNFSHLYNIYYGDTDLFFVKIKDNRGNIAEKKLNGISYSNFIAQKEVESIINEYQVLKPGIARLKIQSFMDIDDRDFKKWIEESFIDISKNKIQHLIIDIRGNSGGRDDYALFLYSFLAKEAFSYHTSLQAATNTFSFLSYTNQDSSLNQTMKEIVHLDTLGRFLLRSSHPTLGVHEKKNPGYPGDVYFLINGETFSAAADFAAVSRENERGLFIGEETGGAAVGNTSNGELILMLPKTNIRIAIPIFKITNAVSDVVNGRGVFPDYNVGYTCRDLINTTDKDLEFTLRLIEVDR